MQEGLKEWLIMDEQNIRFHMEQFEVPYRSTVKFVEYLQRKVKKENNTVIDLGCGAGSVLAYLMKDKRLFQKGYGVDINQEVIRIGNALLKEHKVENCELKEGDIFKLDPNFFGGVQIDGIISTQVFNILPAYLEIVRCMCELKPDWIAFSTLGFEGMIDYNIKLYDYTKDKDGGYAAVFYNIYSLPKMKEYFKSLGYSKFDYIEFEMDIDLPPTNKMGRGTYTIKTERGKRLQISGGMMMPWYFVFVER